MLRNIKESLNAAAGFFYPENCQICLAARATPDEGFVCRRCRQDVRPVVPPLCQRCGLPFEGDITTTFECANCREMDLRFESARAAVIAKGVVREAIHRYKYRQAHWFEPFLAELLAGAARPALREGWDAIVPVPLHPLKEREREFNQAGRLAERLGQATGLPVHTRLVERRAFTRTQTLLSRSERTANVRGAFAVRPGMKLNGERMVLVDDVLTTGATASACTRVLLAAGAGKVCVWTVARGV